jgi:hypothetical protein
MREVPTIAEPVPVLHLSEELAERARVPIERMVAIG